MTLDTQLFWWLHSLAGQSAFGDGVIIFLASYLAYVLIVVFALFVWFASYARTDKLELLVVAAVSTLLARGLVTEAIRYFFPRERPFMALHFTPLFSDSASSFPSGHATFFFALATVVYHYNKRWGVWFFVATTLITVSRVIAGVHYPSDIAAGAIIGVFVGYFTYFFAHRWAQNQYIRPIDK